METLLRAISSLLIKESMLKFLTLECDFRIFLQSTIVSLLYVSFVFNPRLLSRSLKDSWMPSSISSYYFPDNILTSPTTYIYWAPMIVVWEINKGMAGEGTTHLENKQITRNQRWIKVFRDTNSDAFISPVMFLLDTYWKERILNAEKILNREISIAVRNSRRWLLSYSLKGKWNFDRQKMARKGISGGVNFNFIHSFVFIHQIHECLLVSISCH